MATARLTHESKTSPTQKIAILTGIRKKIEKILESDDLRKDLSEILEGVQSSHKQMCRAAFHKAYAALNIVNSITDLDADERETYKDSIKESMKEAGELISQAIKELDNSIARVVHKQQTDAPDKSSKNIEMEDEEESEDRIVEKVKSFEDMKAAYKKIEARRLAEEAKEAAAAKQSKPSKADKKPEDLSEQTLEILKKYSHMRSKLPNNAMGEFVQGIVNMPVMITGQFRTQNIKKAPINIHNIGSGFFLFESLPLFYCNTGMDAEQRTKAMRAWLPEKELDHIPISPDRFFKDENAENLEFTVLIPQEIYKILSPFRFVEKSAFPWEGQKGKKAPKHTRAQLEEYIKSDKRMIALEELSRKTIREYKEATEKKPKLETLIIYHNGQIKELEALIGRNSDGESRRQQKAKVAEIEVAIAKDEEMIKKYQKRIMKFNTKMRSLRARAKELREEIREQYVSLIKERAKRRKAKSKIKKRK